jgi:hypothetical protein
MNRGGIQMPPIRAFDVVRRLRRKNHPTTDPVRNSCQQLMELSRTGSNPKLNEFLAQFFASPSILEAITAEKKRSLIRIMADCLEADAGSVELRSVLSRNRERFEVFAKQNGLVLYQLTAEPDSKVITLHGSPAQAKRIFISETGRDVFKLTEQFDPEDPYIITSMIAMRGMPFAVATDLNVTKETEIFLTDLILFRNEIYLSKSTLKGRLDILLDTIFKRFSNGSQNGRKYLKLILTALLWASFDPLLPDSTETSAANQIYLKIHEFKTELNKIDLGRVVNDLLREAIFDESSTAVLQRAPFRRKKAVFEQLFGYCISGGGGLNNKELEKRLGLARPKPVVIIKERPPAPAPKPAPIPDIDALLTSLKKVGSNPQRRTPPSALEGLMSYLRAKGLVDKDGKWIGSRKVYVQRKTNQPWEVYEYLGELQRQAREAGGDVIRLIREEELACLIGERDRRRKIKVMNDILEGKLLGAFFSLEGYFSHLVFGPERIGIIISETDERGLAFEDIAKRVNQILVEAVEQDDFSHPIFA